MRQTFLDYGIQIPVGAKGQIQTTCPQCSANRKKQNVQCLSLNIEKGVWNCHHCGWAGALKDKDYKPSPPKKTYRKPEPIQTGELPSNVIEWFAKRKIALETLKYFDIHYTKTYFSQSGKEENAIVFPFKRKGEVVNYKYRSGEKHFKQSKDAEKIFFNLDCIDKSMPAIITEGEIDTMTFHQTGYTNVISAPDGAPSPKAKKFDGKFGFVTNCIDDLEGVTEIILATDADEPGRILERELSRILGRERCFRISYPENCKDANEVLIKHGIDGIHELIGSARPFPIEGIISVNDIRDEIFDLYNNGYAQTLSTGFRNLDYHYTVRPGEMTIWTGWTGNGKSEFLDQLLVNLMNLHDWSFGICSLENLPVRNHVQKLLSKLIGKPFFESKFNDGFIDDRMNIRELESAIEKLNDNFNFYAPKDVTIDNILSTAKQLIKQQQIKGLVIDPYNELEHKRPNNLSETEYISEFLSKVRRFARDNEIHVWIVAHPVKPDKEIKSAAGLYQISGSANWANKADNGISIFRNQKDNTVEVHIKKIRFKEVGKPGVVYFDYDIPTGKYREK